MASAKQTIDHDEIRQWVEERGGHPAKVKGTEILRIDYPGFSGESRGGWPATVMTFLYQDKPWSRFSKLVRK